MTYFLGVVLIIEKLSFTIPSSFWLLAVQLHLSFICNSKIIEEKKMLNTTRWDSLFWRIKDEELIKQQSLDKIKFTKDQVNT